MGREFQAPPGTVRNRGRVSCLYRIAETDRVPEAAPQAPNPLRPPIVAIRGTEPGENAE